MWLIRIFCLFRLFLDAVDAFKCCQGARYSINETNCEITECMPGSIACFSSVLNGRIIASCQGTDCQFEGDDICLHENNAHYCCCKGVGCNKAAFTATRLEDLSLNESCARLNHEPPGTAYIYYARGKQYVWHLSDGRLPAGTIAFVMCNGRRSPVGNPSASCVDGAWKPASLKPCNDAVEHVDGQPPMDFPSAENEPRLSETVGNVIVRFYDHDASSAERRFLQRVIQRLQENKRQPRGLVVYP